MALRRNQVYLCTVASRKMIHWAHGYSVLRLLAWKTLVWSKARNAGGEKGTLRLCFKHTLNQACVLEAQEGLRFHYVPASHSNSPNPDHYLNLQ